MNRTIDEINTKINTFCQQKLDKIIKAANVQWYNEAMLDATMNATMKNATMNATFECYNEESCYYNDNNKQWQQNTTLGK